MNKFNTDQQDAKNHFNTALRHTGSSTQPESIEEEKSNEKTEMKLMPSYAFEERGEVSDFGESQT